MKKFVKGLSVCIAVCMMLQLVCPMMYTKSSADNNDFLGIEQSTIQIRYDEDMDESLYSSGKGYTAGACMYGDYLVVPAAFLSLGDERRNMVVVYDMSKGDPVEVKRWDMADLDMTVRDGVETGKQDIVYGIYVTDEYLLVPVKIIANNPAAGNSGYTMGLYVYENPFKGTTIPDTPTRIMTSDPDIEKAGCSVLSNRSQWFDIGRHGGTTMQMIGDKLITYYGIPGNSHMTVTDMSGDYPVSSYIEEADLLKYTVGGVEVSSTKATDIVFDGNKAYIVALTDSEGNDGYRQFGVYTIDFSTPESPVVSDLVLFDSDILMTGDSGYCNASMTLKDGFAYVTTFSNNSGYLKNKRPHLYTLKKTGDSFSFIKEFELTSDMYWIAGAGGMGSTQVIGNLLIGLTGGEFHQCCTYLRFNDARDEIIAYKKVGALVDDSDGNATANAIVYGSKIIFPLMQTGVYNATDFNKAVLCVFDVLSAGVDFNDTEKIENVVFEDIYASFNEPYAVNGINRLHITGKNTGNTSSVQVIFGIYENDILVKTELKEKHTISSGGDIDIYESIDLSGYDLNDIVLKAYLWEDCSTIKPLTQVCSPPEVGFTFTLTEESATSAGVYDEENHLIRTLWSNVRYEAGTHSEGWDGKDDYGNFAPDGNYRIDVLSNNVEYKHFVDVIGNTSDCSSWNTYISSGNSITDMAYDAKTDRLYYASGHVEGGYGLRYVDGETLYKNNLMDKYKPNMTAFRVAVDGERIYWASEEIQMKDYEGKGYRNFNSFIYATDDGGNPYQFEYGERQPSKWTNVETSPDDPSGPYPYAINRHTVPYPEQDNRISGLEVQQQGNLLFSAYKDLGKVFVNDKNTGELLYTHNSAMPGSIALQGEDILYIGEQNEDETYTVNKYSIAKDGTLTYEGSLDYEFASVIGLGVSPSGARLAVADGGDCDRVYVFDTATNTLITTYGSGESYFDDPTVKEGKLMFDDSLAFRDGLQEHTFVELMSDTMLLVGDSGNGRVYKLDISGAEPTIMREILYLRCGYSVSYVKNDITRIFGDIMEYSFDYEKAEQYAAGEIPFEEVWDINCNYMLQMLTKYPMIKGTIGSKFDGATKLENGIVYFRMRHGDEGKNFLYMLDGKEIKPTGIDVTNMDLHEDGSLYYKTFANKVDYYEGSFWKKELLGFDENNIPQYGEPVLLAGINSDRDGITPFEGNLDYSRVPITDSGKIIMLKCMGPAYSSIAAEKTPMHLGAINISEGYNDEWEWMTAPQTHRNYGGFFPEDGYFDIGNTVAYTTWNPMVYKDIVFFQYRGEGYQGGMADKFLQYNDNGLLVGVFGRTGYEYGGQYEVGGSVWSGSIMELIPTSSMNVTMVGMPGNSDVAYIFQNTEGPAGGVHVNRVSGLDSIAVQSSNVTYKNALVQGIKYTCFNDSQLDSAYIEKTGIASNFSLPCINEENTNHSVRFEGYFRADYTGNAQIGIKTDGKTTLVVDSRTIIDNAEGDSAGYIYLEKGTLYNFKLEVAGGKNGLSRLEVGYLNGAKYTDLDMRRMYCDHPQKANKNGINLLEGLSYGKEVKSGTYGWTMESYGGTGDSRLEVKTNRWNYRRDGVNDISMYLEVKRNREYTRNEVDVIRSLGEINSSDYVVDMDVSFTGHIGRAIKTPRKDGTTSVVIELLDKNDKIIGNFYLAGGDWNLTDIYALSNEQELCRIPKPKQHQGAESVPKMMDVKINLPQNLKFYLEDGKVVVEYTLREKDGELINTYKVVTTPVDSDADITAPAKVRFARYNEFATGGYGTTIDVTRFMLYK